MLKIVGAALLSLLLIFIGVKVFSFVVEEHGLASDLQSIESRLTKAKTDEADLQAEDQYLANPLNLEKELRARFNYKKPGETMIIIVPPQTTSTTSTATIEK